MIEPSGVWRIETVTRLAWDGRERDWARVWLDISNVGNIEQDTLIVAERDSANKAGGHTFDDRAKIDIATNVLKGLFFSTSSNLHIHKY